MFSSFKAYPTTKKAPLFCVVQIAELDPTDYKQREITTGQYKEKAQSKTANIEMDRLRQTRDPRHDHWVTCSETFTGGS